MLFLYKIITPEGKQQTGQIDAVNVETATESLERRGFIIISLVTGANTSVFGGKLAFFDKVSQKSVVIMSRQLSALFDAQVSALKAFSLMSDTTNDRHIKFALQSIVGDLQGGISISGAMEKHPAVFSNFYINMVRAGEESGKLMETFQYLADYLERQYELTAKTRNALVYPAFVVVTFIAVMIMMLVFLIPKLSVILIETGQQLPLYTRAVIGLASFMVHYGIYFLILIIILGIYLYTSSRSIIGKRSIDSFKLRVPMFGELFKKLYLSRIADNMDTMLSSGIPVLRTLEITSQVVDNQVYGDIIQSTINDVKAGISISASFEKHAEMPPVMVSMIRIGEETGSLGPILKKMAHFYKREVDGAVDTLIGLIEPVMIVALGIGVGFLLTSILIPIYNIASAL